MNATKDDRRDRIMDAALRLAAAKGYKNWSREAVATAARVSAGLVNHYFGTMAALQTEVMREAVARELPGIVAQGLVYKDPVALAAPERLRKSAIKTLC